ncbi:MAG TPA: ADOP family duplicated permease, partial [Luteitalea sp.]|nr:ADOP family duplicated permease [Luteitalea sp.]
PEGLSGVRVSPQLFGLLGASPLHGRLLTDAETVDGQDTTVVLSHGLWRRRFGADPSVVGRTIRLSDRPVVVVGILPATFTFPQLTHHALARTDAAEPEYFRPLAWPDRVKTSWGEFDNFVVVRAARNSSLEGVRDELTVLTRREFEPAPIHPFPIMEPLASAITSEARRPLWMLLGAVATTLLIACVNVATLLGSRWLGRQREIAIRCALGAGRMRLVSLVAAESLLLAGVGGLIGAVAARIALGAIMAWVPGNIPRLADVRIDVAALAFAAALTTLCALVCTVLPAWHTVSADPDDALRDGSRSATDSRRAGMVRSWLVGAEVVLTTMLLVVSGLLLTSFVNVLRVDPGFRTSSLLAADLLLPSARYGTPAARVQFHDRLLGDLQQVPGFVSAGTTVRAPLDGNASVDSIIAVGDSRPDAEQPVSTHVQVSHGFFDAIGVPLLHGRLPVTADRQRRVAVISERTARAVWGEPARAVGRSYSRGRRDVTWEVIGVVGDTRQWGLEQEVGLVTYVPYRVGDADAQLSVVVRTGPSLPVATAFARLRDVVRAIDPELPVQRPRTIDDVVDGALAPRRFQLTLVAAFAAGGLLLACIGIYGVSAASVERRHHELAIRLALGATPRAVQRLVVRQGLTPVAAGLVIGLGLGVLVARGLASLFFGVTSTPPLVFAVTIGVVLVVALIACIGPASRAARIRLAGALRGV